MHPSLEVVEDAVSVEKVVDTSICHQLHGLWVTFYRNDQPMYTCDFEAHFVIANCETNNNNLPTIPAQGGSPNPWNVQYFWLEDFGEWVAWPFDLDLVEELEADAGTSITKLGR